MRHAEDVWDIYLKNPKIAEDKDLDDRFRDICETLFIIGSVIDAVARDESAKTVKGLINLAVDLAKNRKDQEDLNGFIRAVVNLMAGIVGEEERFISTDDLFAKFQEDSDLSFIQSKKIAFFLSKLGLYRTPPRRIGDRGGVGGYVVTRRWIDDLRDWYA